MLPVLKDHGSAGVTGALKNMSHGSVNNVARSHSTPATNVCNQFIPEVVSHPILRKKCVLQIMDGIKGVFQRGPFGAQPGVRSGSTTRSSSPPTRWRWTTSSGGSSTPSGRRRTSRRSPPTGKMGLDPLGTEGFDIRQPQHIALAANLGLGIFDFKSPKGRRQSIDHRVIDVA